MCLIRGFSLPIYTFCQSLYNSANMNSTIKNQLKILSPKIVAVINNIKLEDVWAMIWEEYGITSIHERYKLPKHIRLNTFSNGEKIKRNKEIIKLREKGWTYQQISDKYGISRQRAEHIVNKK